MGDSLAVAAAVSALSVTRDGLLAVGDLEGTTTIWHLGVRAPLWLLKDEAQGKVSAAISGMAFAPDPSRLVAATSDGARGSLPTVASALRRAQRSANPRRVALEGLEDHQRLLHLGMQKHGRRVVLATQTLRGEPKVLFAYHGKLTREELLAAL